MLRDKYGRNIDYLRIAVTDRCNLRCTYCMPAEGIQYMDRRELLTYEEILYLIDIMAGAGIKKIRITGGEPFVRRDLMDLLENIIAKHPEIALYITTNGTLIGPYIERLEALGLAGINFSLDTLDRKKFELLTRRDEFENVYSNLQRLMHSRIPLKINCVAMMQSNMDDMADMIKLTENHAVEVRFIEEMPFNGAEDNSKIYWNAMQLEQFIRSLYPDIRAVDADANSSARLFKQGGSKGIIGIIDAFSRTFCATCNRLRLNAKGEIITCLYGKGEKSLRDMIRSGASHDTILAEIERIVHQKYKDGHEAEAKNRNSNSFFESMSTIGG